MAVTHCERARVDGWGEMLLLKAYTVKHARTRRLLFPIHLELCAIECIARDSSPLPGDVSSNCAEQGGSLCHVSVAMSL